jgi:AcrR family transcriptional regulator
MAGATAKTTEQPAKRQQILAGARKAFAELGYERTSVDLVAARAGVSKATVYNHFEDKKALFVACFSEEVDAMRDRLLGLLGEPEGDVESALRVVGEQLLNLRLSSPVECLYRHTIAEAARFPEIGRYLFDHGPKTFFESLAAYLGRWRDRGVLRIDDARSAAVQFWLLCQGDLVLRSQLAVPSTPGEVRETVERAVATFLRAYRA